MSNATDTLHGTVVRDPYRWLESGDAGDDALAGGTGRDTVEGGTGADEGRDARAFEPVVQAIETVVAGVEVVRPGVVLLAVRGPARHVGSEEALAELLAQLLHTDLALGHDLRHSLQGAFRVGRGLAQR